MIFELHAHTHYSRGTKIPTEVMMKPREVVRLAKKSGIDAIAITDHKLISGWEEARKEAKKQGVLFIPGMEIQANEGHVIGLGMNEFIENNLSAEETLERIREQGAYSVAPHPYDIKNDGIKEKCVLTDAVEVFNSFGMDRIANWYTARKASRENRPMVVGSDVHMPDMMGLSVNIAEAHTLDEFFSEARKGRVGFRTSCVPINSVVVWARERINRSYEDVLEYIETNYWQPKRWVSNLMVRKFVGSKSIGWNILGRVSVGASFLYSGVKLLTY